MNEEKKTESDTIGETKRTLDKYQLRAEAEHKLVMEANQGLIEANKALVAECGSAITTREIQLARDQRYEEQDKLQWDRNRVSHEAYLAELKSVREARAAEITAFSRIATALEQAVELERQWQNKDK